MRKQADEKSQRKSITVRGLDLGCGLPKICVPILARTEEEIMHQAAEIVGSAADLVEWRADAFRGLENADNVRTIMRKLHEVLGELPILFTVRTDREGGLVSTSDEQYLRILTDIMTASKEANGQCGNGSGTLQEKPDFLPDLIDVELSRGESVMSEAVKHAHQMHVFVIGSSHDFQKTPGQDEILQRLRKMQEYGCDIAKLAAMPENEQDVLALLCATRTAVNELEIPVITMSMGELGMVSRMCGRLDGSCLTFGTVGPASAPGQMNAEKLKGILELLGRS